MKKPLYLSHMGIACSLGIGKKDVADALWAGSLPKTQTKNLLSGRKTLVYTVGSEPPVLPGALLDLNSRNNRLLMLVLDQIKSDIDQVKETYGPHRIGIVMATSTSGMHEGEVAFTSYKKENQWPEGYQYEQQEPAGPSLFAEQYLGVTGPCYTISTACSSGGKAFCSAARLIRSGICDAVVVGGVDTLCDMTLNGFDSLNLISETLCSPFSQHRQGITIGEGAAVFIMTKTPAPVEFSGSGESSDAYHISTPDPLGKGAEIAIRQALQESQLQLHNISYVNLHGTGTIVNDRSESHCFHRLFGDQVFASSTKRMTGHTLGACGSIEAGFLWLTLMQEGEIFLPPHVWDHQLDPDLPFLHLVNPGDHLESSLNRPGQKISLLSNSFAFGGSNVSIILSRSTS